MIDLLILAAFVIFSVSAGLRARRRASASLEEYFLAGRSESGWRAGLSMAATQFAADTPLLAAGLVATGGLFSLWRLWIYGISFLLLGIVLAGPWRRAGVLTDAELVEIRYSGTGVALLRGLKAVYFGLVINCTVLAMVLVAATRIATPLLPWHEWIPAQAYELLEAGVRTVGFRLAGMTGPDVWIATTDSLLTIVLILAFVGLYSTTGGLRGVVTTDVGQLLLMLVASAIYAWFAVEAAGGRVLMIDRLVDLYGSERAAEMLSLTPTDSNVLLPFLAVIAMQWLFQMNSDGTGYLAQRSMACRSERDARFAGVLFAWVQILVRSLVWLPIAVALLVIYPMEGAAAAGTDLAASREQTFVDGILDLLPSGARGLMLTGLLAALASTVDTHLNWGASYFANDLYKGLVNERLLGRRPGSREMVVAARASSLLIIAVSLLVMTQLGSIQTAWKTSLLFGAGIGSVLVMRWLWERITLWSEVAAIVSSVVAAPLLILRLDSGWVQLLVMASASTTAAVLAALAGPETEPARLTAFYARVRPPGWWTSSAERHGESPAVPRIRLSRGLATLAACAASLYLLLLAGARLLVPLPGSSGAISAACAAGGLLLVPFWWRRATRPDA
jgi:Na+/proline symporter